MKKVIITGATSGIGRALAELMAQKDYKVGITGRRTDRLQELKNKYNHNLIPMTMDVSDVEKSQKQFHQLVEQLGGCDIVVLNAAVGWTNPGMNWEYEDQMIATNVKGFTSLCNTATLFFTEQKRGMIVGISSVAAIRGNRQGICYGATKAFISHFLDGVRHYAKHAKMPITVLTVEPGFVDTEMTKDQIGMFWVATPEKAAKQILKAIEKQKTHIYVTKRWRLIAWIMKLLPNFIYYRS